jgi:hypothetical protein
MLSQSAQLLADAFPTHLHLASIMSERTQDERETFGKVKFESDERCLTEDKVDWLIDQYLIDISSPFELIKETIGRCRSRFLAQFSKFEAACNQQVFFTETGIELRKEKLKMKILLQTEH